MERAIEARLVHPGDGGRLAYELEQLVPDARAGHGGGRSGSDRDARQALAVRIEATSQARFVAQRPQQPRRVVDEAAVVEDADDAIPEVAAATVRVVHPPALPA